ncbi:Signal Transduction Histidine Kinase [Pedobacter sp. BAL39]|uniref:sensor histidine kinase n=1 Tax=Pedobacter sp. BAL39 TaxID=391596 RepID=UPI0001559985|nr:histidine kinase dimerization/phosphoacceptor domain -containing protein [Pedobacter sp. BAL39]EDM38626.1 Signal Transduction Histidine Kinase [Pedobacter sp. BAL39]
MTKLRNATVSVFCTILLIACGCAAKAQLDYKNALPELLNRYAKSGSDVAGVRLALTISNFYLYNKSYNRYVDSALYYSRAAENVSKMIGYQKGREDAEVLRATALLFQKKYTAVREMAAGASGALYCRLYLLMGKHFLEKDGGVASDLNFADSCLTAAQSYASSHRMPVLFLNSKLYSYHLLVERGTDLRTADQLFTKLVSLCKAQRQPAIEARLWFTRASVVGPAEAETAECFLKGAMLAATAKDTSLAIWARKEIADVNLRRGKFDLAAAQLQQVLQQYTRAGYKNLQFTYNLLSAVLTHQARFEKAMQYGIAAVAHAESTGTDLSLNFMQYSLAQLCASMGQREESMAWYRKCLENSAHEPHYPYGIYRTVSRELIDSGKAALVLKKLEATMRVHPPDASNYLFVLMLKGDCYAALNRPELAERNYMEMIELTKPQGKEDFGSYWIYQSVAAFFVQQKEYKKADYYLSKVLSAPREMISTTALASAYQFKFKTDSAAGNYLEAIKHFQAAKGITDSVFNHLRLKQTEELQIQFKTAEKDKENLVLRNRNTLQRSDLEKELLQKKLIGTGLFASVMITGLMIYLYRAKQRSNNDLQNQQKEINDQNQQLNVLLGEKEWLIKEIHHRVKNNLQIISSLLNTQSAYLHTSEARTAIRDSQNRMQAISIVHHKLYQSNDLSTVNFQAYIEELVHSICDSFHSDKGIQFDFNLVEAHLNTTVTVPIGLMLNEAITNSIKYAFADTELPRIAIAMVETEDDQYELSIRDNGKGLPENFDVDGCSSLGINLMVGLSSQIQGRFSICSDQGTVIRIVFPKLMG